MESVDHRVVIVSHRGGGCWGRFPEPPRLHTGTGTIPCLGPIVAVHVSVAASFIGAGPDRVVASSEPTAPGC